MPSLLPLTSASWLSLSYFYRTRSAFLRTQSGGFLKQEPYILDTNDVVATCSTKRPFCWHHLDKPGEQKIEWVGRDRTVAFPAWFSVGAVAAWNRSFKPI